MKIDVNGDPRQLPEGTTLAELLRSLEMNPKHVAVERNRRLVPRATHADCVLEEGDRLEIVTLVGGG